MWGTLGMQGSLAGALGAECTGGCRSAGGCWLPTPLPLAHPPGSRERRGWELEEPVSLSAVPHRCAPHAKRPAAGGGAGDPQQRGSRAGLCPADGATSPPQRPAAVRRYGGPVPHQGLLPRGSPVQLSAPRPPSLPQPPDPGGPAFLQGPLAGLRGAPVNGTSPSSEPVPTCCEYREQQHGWRQGWACKPLHTHTHTYTYTLTGPLPASDLEKWVLHPMGTWQRTPVPLKVAVCSTVPVPKRAQAVASDGHDAAPPHLREESEVLGENSLTLSWAILCGAVQCWGHPSGH